MKNKKIKYLRDGRAPIPDSDITSKLMRANKAKNTKPEISLRKLMWSHNIKGYRLHHKKIPGRPDIAFIKLKIAIFVQGCFWHRCPYCNPPLPKSNSEFWRNKFQMNVERDQKKFDELKNCGWKILMLWECQIKKEPLICLGEILNLLPKKESN